PMPEVSSSPGRRWAVGLLALGLAASACSGGSAQFGAQAPSTTAPASTTTAATGSKPAAASAGTVFPGAQWATTDPAVAGMEPAKLDEIAERAKEGGSNCFLVVRDGKLVKEWYWNGTDAKSTQEVFSATKSYTSMLVGIAQN